MIGRYTTLNVGVLNENLGYAPLQPIHLLGLFFGISGLSLACFFLLRQLVKHSIEENRRLAHFDPLTGLPNRRLFQDCVEQVLIQSKRDGTPLAAFFLDLDVFKRVNDTLGHTAGNELLSEVARRLVGIVRLSDSVARVDGGNAQIGVARLGGDEFTLLLTGISEPLDAERVAHRVLEALRAPFQVADHELIVTASLRIAVYPFDGENVDTLLKNADTAMYCAKGRGRNNFQCFSASMNDASIRKLELEERLQSGSEMAGPGSRGYPHGRQYLRRFPISRVKIDRSFVEGIPEDLGDMAFCGAIISMAQHLMMSVVGEGVETEQQALREMGCKELQGFLFSPAVPTREFLRFLEPGKPE